MRLHFDLVLVRRLLDHSKAATERGPTCDQLYEGRFRRDGKDADLDNINSHNFPTAEDVDPAKIPPGLWLVGDQGIYLMSNGRPPLLVDPADTRNVTAHAAEASPAANPDDWWDVKCAAFGGDDGVVFLELPFAEAGTCQWPIGEPGKAGFHLCGGEPAPSKPYCPSHCGRAYVRPRIAIDAFAAS